MLKCTYVCVCVCACQADGHVAKVRSLPWLSFLPVVLVADVGDGGDLEPGNPLNGLPEENVTFKAYPDRIKLSKPNTKSTLLEELLLNPGCDITDTFATHNGGDFEASGTAPKYVTCG